jgi:hypothetical protein
MEMDLRDIFPGKTVRGGEINDKPGIDFSSESVADHASGKVAGGMAGRSHSGQA